MSLIDHLLAAILIVGLPVSAARTFARLKAAVEAGDPVARLREYRKTIVRQWALVVGLGLHWYASGREFGMMGFTVPTGWRLALTVVAALAVLTLFIGQMRAVLRSPDLQARVRGQLAAQSGIGVLIPRTASEARVFVGLALTAGFCEEVLYRGFMWWYFAGTLASPWLAAVAAVALFGLAHAYQGRRGMVMTGLVGGVNLGIYLATGSLIAPVAMHASIDVTNGLMGRGSVESESDLKPRNAPVE